MPDSHQVSQPTVPVNYSNIKNHTELINQPSPKLKGYCKIFIIKLGGKGEQGVIFGSKELMPNKKRIYMYISMNTVKHRVRCLSHYR